MNVIGKRIRKLRQDNKLSQKEFGKLFDLAESTIGMYERDERKPDYETLNKFADYFEVTADYLLGRTDKQEPLAYREAGISDEDYSNLTAYQREVIDFFLNMDRLAFKEHPENLLDALEQFEIYYELLKKQQDRKK